MNSKAIKVTQVQKEIREILELRVIKEIPEPVV